MLRLWKIMILSGLVAVWCGLSRAADLPAPSGETIVAADAKLELLFTRSAPISGGLTEGPAVAPDGSIYFTDIPFGKEDGMILRFDPKTGKTTVFTDKSGKANGLIFDSQGRLLACEGAGYGGRRISRWNVQTGARETVVDQYQGKKFNAPNDICLDAQGNLYFSDPKYVGHEPRELEYRAVYRVTPDGKIMEATHDVSKPNGVALSPDGKTLYVAEHDNGTDNLDTDTTTPKRGPMRIYAFEVDEQGKAGKRRTLVEFGTKIGCDGMTVDRSGNVYLTVRDPSRPGVLVVEPKEGREVGFIPTGPGMQAGDQVVGLPSNVEFGMGAESHVLYVTIDKSLYRIPLKTRGFHRQYGDRL